MTSKKATTAAMKVREFILRPPAQIAAELPKSLRAFRVREQSGNLVKLCYGERLDIHYEVRVQRRHGQMEMGFTSRGTRRPTIPAWLC